MSSLFVVISDLHSGSTLALCPPAITLDEGGTYRANKYQMWLWQRWLDIWERVEQLRGDKELYLAIVGEIGEGHHHNSVQLISVNKIDQFRIAHKVLEPIKALKPDYTFIFRGTEAHSGPGGWFDELMADGLRDELNVQENPDTKQLASWYLNLWIEGIQFDITHHAKTGNLPWTGAGAVERGAIELSWYYLSRGEKVPQVAIRGHKHSMFDTGDNAPIRMLTLPGWKFPDSYLHKVAAGKLPQVGGYIFEIDGKKIINLEKIRKEAPRGKAWKKK